MISYEVGDRVICIQKPAYVPVGKAGTILKVEEYTVDVRWDCAHTFTDTIDFDGIQPEEIFEDDCEIPL